MSRSKSSKRWLKEHFDDVYVKLAQQQGYRSRAVFKLLEINEKDRLLQPGMLVVDLGAAPGGWSQIAVKAVIPKGKVFALDILPMDALEGVEFIQGDFTQELSFNALMTQLQGQNADIVLSDMSPNLSGMSAVDQPRGMYLAELALDFAQQVLKPDGAFLVKVFQGAGFDNYLQILRKAFKQVAIRKPKASRQRSREVYLLAKGFK